MIDESGLILALRSGDQAAFTELVNSHTPALLRAARGYVPSHAVAEEVVQETWIALVKGVAGFEGRSSLRAWLFVVMSNIAKARRIRERRDREVLLLSAGSNVDTATIRGPGVPSAGGRKERPANLRHSPEGSILGRELRAVAQPAVDTLPPRQRKVVMLRDFMGFDSTEVCEVLDISAANQRVLLHRGRAAIRRILEDYATGSE